MTRKGVLAGALGCLAVPVAGVLAVVIGLQLIAFTSPKASDIRQLPEASIMYPGSTLIELHSSEGWDGAEVYFTYRVDAPWSSIQVYYHDKLIAIGYQQQPGGSEYLEASRTILVRLVSGGGPGSQSTTYSYAITQH